MRIIGLQATNIKKLRAINLTFDETAVVFAGENESGKSSSIDAMFYLLAGKGSHPSNPIRNGQERAEVKLTLGESSDEPDYIVSLVLIRKSGRSSLTVSAPSGAEFPEPATLLKRLMSVHAIDPGSFINAKPKDRLEMLRRIVPLDIDADALDRANEADYAARRDLNRDVDSLKERVSTLEVGIDPAMDTSLVDVESLTAEMAAASDRNAAIDRDESSRTNQDQLLVDLREQRLRIEAEIRALQQKQLAVEDRIATGEKLIAARVPLPTKIDISGLGAQINEATKTNAARGQQARQRTALREAVDSLAVARAKSQKLTEAMDARTAEKTAAIARAPFPIVGLSFGRDEVLFEGVPFDQISSGKQIDVSCAISMAENPTLKIVFIRAGALMDKAARQRVFDRAKERGYQVIMELVSTDKTVGIFMEDGEVTAIDGVPVDTVKNVDDPYMESIGA